MATSEKTVRNALGGYIAETLTKAGVTSPLGIAEIRITGEGTAEVEVLSNTVVDDEGETITPILTDNGTGEYTLTFAGCKQGTQLIVTGLVPETNVAVATNAGADVLITTFALADGTAEDGNAFVTIRQIIIPE